MKAKNCGFTLIELLIVISILALLATIGLTVYTNVLKNARDSQRKTDIGFIQSALEQYFADSFYYPMVSATCDSLNSGKLVFSLPNCTLKNTSGTKTYMNSVPTESISSRSQYSYTPLPSTCDNATSAKCTSYCLYVSMENTSNTVPAGCIFTGNYNYGVTVP